MCHQLRAAPAQPGGVRAPALQPQVWYAPVMFALLFTASEFEPRTQYDGPHVSPLLHPAAEYSVVPRKSARDCPAFAARPCACAWMPCAAATGRSSNSATARVTPVGRSWLRRTTLPCCERRRRTALTMALRL